MGTCHRDDIEEIRAGLATLATDVGTYETCEDLKTQTISSVASVSGDIDALVLQLLTDDSDAWQSVFTEYSMPCSRIPLRYCDSMKVGTDEACAKCNDACQEIGDPCQIS